MRLRVTDTVDDCRVLAAQNAIVAVIATMPREAMLRHLRGELNGLPLSHRRQRKRHSGRLPMAHFRGLKM